MLPCLFFISEGAGVGAPVIRLLPFMVNVCFGTESNISFYSVSEKEP